MISKVFSGHSFYHACRYMCNKPGAEVLETEGVREHDPKLMADDFMLQNELRPGKKQACFHSVLSFYPGEDPGHEVMTEIAKKYLEGIGITNTQYAITLHTDKAHLHLHIIANMVNNDGRSIPDGRIGYRGKQVAQRLTQEYKLTPALNKDLGLTHLESLNPSEANRYKIYMAIMTSLPHCRNMEDLEKRLVDQGIETLYKYKGQTQEKQGVSFKTGDDCFKGSKVDRKCSLGNLEKVLRLQQKGAIEKRPGAKVIPLKGRALAPSSTRFNISEPVASTLKGIAQAASKMIEELLKVEESDMGHSYDFERELRKRKRRKHRH